MNIRGNNCLKVVLEDGAINIPAASQVVIDEDGKTYVDGMSLEEYVKKQRQ